MVITAQKCSDRRTQLLRLQAYVQEMININEEADRVRRILLAQGEASNQIATTVGGILSGGGPTIYDGTTIYPSATSGKLVDRVILMLYSGTYNRIGWEYTAE